MAGRGKRGPDIAPKMRNALYSGFIKAARNRGMTLSDFAAQMWEDDWKAAATVLGKFLPREQQVTGKVTHDHAHTHTHAGVSETVSFIEGVIGTGEEGTPKKPLSH